MVKKMLYCPKNCVEKQYNYVALFYKRFTLFLSIFFWKLWSDNVEHCLDVLQCFFFSHVIVWTWSDSLLCLLEMSITASKRPMACRVGRAIKRILNRLRVAKIMSFWAIWLDKKVGWILKMFKLNYSHKICSFKT